MLALAGSLYLASTLAFAVTAGIVGVRLVVLSFRSGQLPERLLGLGVMLTAALGYGLLIVGQLGRAAALEAGEATGAYEAATLFGWLFHDVGVVCMLGFVVAVFRPSGRWPRVLAGAMTAVLWGGFALHVTEGGLTGALPGVGYWISFSVIGTYPLWSGGEAYRVHRMMRRRVALGLADPLVTNRFLLWALASACAAAAIWTVNVPIVAGYAPGDPAGEAVTVGSMLVTAAFGITTVSIYWLTFFPPVWYQRRFHPEAEVTT